MKAYNPKHWWELIFNFHKSDSFRMLIPAMAALAIYSAVLCFITVELEILKLRSTTVMHSMLGFVMSLLLVFRTNTAYDRWWEGRKLWGDLVNNSRNLMLKIDALLPRDRISERERFARLIGNYAFALKEHLRGGFRQEELEDEEQLRVHDLKAAPHVPNRIASQMYVETEQMRSNGLITGDHLLFVNDELRSFTNIAGGCERIKKTPIPYSYSTFIKRMILLYVVTLPLGMVADLKWATIPLVLFAFYAFAGLELIAEEIEDPFGRENNDLPTDDLAATIRRNVKDIAGISGK